MTLHSLSDIALATSWWAHGRHKDDVLDLHEGLFFLGSVIPSLMIHPLTQDFNRRLGSIGLLLGHVEIIDEDNETLSSRRAVDTLSSLFKLLIESILGLVC